MARPTEERNLGAGGIHFDRVRLERSLAAAVHFAASLSHRECMVQQLHIDQYARVVEFRLRSDAFILQFGRRQAPRPLLLVHLVSLYDKFRVEKVLYPRASQTKSGNMSN